jgi:hypothetical protein
MVDLAIRPHSIRTDDEQIKRLDDFRREAKFDTLHEALTKALDLAFAALERDGP